jgi:hypothetical protein
MGACPADPRRHQRVRDHRRLRARAACDLLIASAARFADTHARVGILPGWGLSQKLPRLIGIARAKELSLTGNFLSAEQAEKWGLVNRVVAPADLLPTCLALARDMLSCEPKTMRAYKALIDRGFARPLAEGIALERDASREHVKQVSAADVAARRQAIQSADAYRAGRGAPRASLADPQKASRPARFRRAEPVGSRSFASATSAHRALGAARDAERRLLFSSRILAR